MKRARKTDDEWRRMDDSDDGWGPGGFAAQVLGGGGVTLPCALGCALHQVLD